MPELARQSFRVDKPLPKPVVAPPKKAEPKPAAVAAAPKPPVVKRLTRLEKLRLQAKKDSWRSRVTLHSA